MLYTEISYNCIIMIHFKVHVPPKKKKSDCSIRQVFLIFCQKLLWHFLIFKEKGTFFLGDTDTTWGTDTTFENFLPHIYSLVMYFSFLCVNNCYDRCNKGYHIVKRL